MSYKYEDYFKGLNIKESKKVGSDLNDIFNARDELNEVYSQAVKADEYEAKAKAFDHIENLVKTELTSDDLYNDARNNDYVAGMLRVYERVDYIIDEYESGEYDAKK